MVSFFFATHVTPSPFLVARASSSGFAPPPPTPPTAPLLSKAECLFGKRPPRICVGRTEADQIFLIPLPPSPGSRHHPPGICLPPAIFHSLREFVRCWKNFRMFCPTEFVKRQFRIILHIFRVRFGSHHPLHYSSLAIHSVCVTQSVAGMVAFAESNCRHESCLTGVFLAPPPFFCALSNLSVVRRHLRLFWAWFAKCEIYTCCYQNLNSYHCLNMVLCISQNFRLFFFKLSGLSINWFLSVSRALLVHFSAYLFCVTCSGHGPMQGRQRCLRASKPRALFFCGQKKTCTRKKEKKILTGKWKK